MYKCNQLTAQEETLFRKKLNAHFLQCQNLCIIEKNSTMRFLPFLLIIIITSGCSNKHLLPAYKKYSPKHRVIAIIPPESRYTGRLP